MAAAAVAAAMLHAAFSGQYILDMDSARQHSGRWRCLVHAHLTEALDESLNTNYTGLGWSAELVAPLIGNLSGCETLVADEPLRSEWLMPLATALHAHCASLTPDLQPSLRIVDFDGSLLHDEGISLLAPALASCPTLNGLYVHGNLISDAGARALGDAFHAHQGLGVLDLSSNSVRDSGVAHLTHRLLRLPSQPLLPGPLTDLWLHHNLIGPAGTAALADALRDNVILRVLLLDGNPVGDDGLSALALALRERIAGRPSALRRLGLSVANVTDAGLVQLLEQLREYEWAPPLDEILLDGNAGVGLEMRGTLHRWLSLRAPSPGAQRERETGLFRTLLSPTASTTAGAAAG